MEQLIAFLKTLSPVKADRWEGNAFIVSRIIEGDEKDIKSIFDTANTNFYYNDMSPSAYPSDSRIHSKEYVQGSSFLSLGFLNKPYDEGMTRLYIASHTENHRINPNRFEWLICFPTDESIAPSLVVSSCHTLEEQLLKHTLHQVLSLISMLKLDVDYEEMRKGLDHQTIEYFQSLHKVNLDEINHTRQKNTQVEIIVGNTDPECSTGDYFNLNSSDEELPEINYHGESVPFLYDLDNSQLNNWKENG